MNALRLGLTLLIVTASLSVWSQAGAAADMQRSDSDCSALLERWAGDPKAAPKRVIDACKKQLAAAPASPRAPAVLPVAAIVDPCAGPDAANSVLCWGPWTTLAPAAGGPPLRVAAADLGSIECRPDVLTDQCGPSLQEAPPLAPCTPGTPCGFATVVAGLTSQGDPEDTTFAPFTMAPDGSNFTVDPGGDNEIASVDGMSGTITPRKNDDYGNLRYDGRSGDEWSELWARVVRDDEDEILLAADIWTRGSDVTHDGKSGYFAWGTSTSQAGLDALRGGGASLTYTGAMSVDKRTTGLLTVNFGSTPGWAGTWTNTGTGTNPGYTFGAGGTVSGVNLISRADQFTDNVVGEGNYVQGALLGEQGNRGLAHIINVNLADHGLVKDVGLLREVVPGP